MFLSHADVLSQECLVFQLSEYKILEYRLIVFNCPVPLFIITIYGSSLGYDCSDRGFPQFRRDNFMLQPEN
jgi:hypothetical protein